MAADEMMVAGLRRGMLLSVARIGEATSVGVTATDPSTRLSAEMFGDEIVDNKSSL